MKPTYSSYGYGTGRFSVLTAQELLTDEQTEAMAHWPSLAAIVPITRLSIPSRLDSIDDLRAAAASLQADILMVYTIDTAFRVQGKGYGPLTVVLWHHPRSRCLRYGGCLGDSRRRSQWLRLRGCRSDREAARSHECLGLQRYGRSEAGPGGAGRPLRSSWSSFPRPGRA